MNNTILNKKKVLLTAGPTREGIDPVRYISNHSTGKMGYALAETLLNQGATVFLVSGPLDIQLLHPNLVLIKVNSASEMYQACCRFFEQADIAIFAAAVADYRPESMSHQKIKKDQEVFSIRMIKNIDIAFEFGKLKRPDQLSVGFALETHDEFKNAIGKLERKNFDMIVLNSMNDEKAGFGFDTNQISIIRKDFSRKTFPLKPKTEVAADIIAELVKSADGLFNTIHGTVLN